MPNFWCLLVHIPNLCMKSSSNFLAALSWIFIPIRQAMCHQMNDSSSLEFGNVEARAGDFIWRTEKAQTKH